MSPPSAGRADLWLLSAADVEEASLPLALLGQEERRRADAFVHSRDRIRYVAAHVALRRVLASVVGRPAPDLRFGREACPCCGGPHGRPRLTGADASVHFSLSHGGDLILIGVAGVPIGVDVEGVLEPDTVADLAPLLHPAERRELAALREEGRAEAFARLWTRKEAYLKGLGTGLGRDLAADYLGTRTPASDGDAPSPPLGWTVANIEAGADRLHAAACAVRGPVLRPRLARLPSECLADEGPAYSGSGSGSGVGGGWSNWTRMSS